MKEAARVARNTQRLQECFPVFGNALRRAIAELEKRGFRPRIQDAWRSPKDQEAAFLSGHSKLRFGFHNVTGADGRKEALAVDLLDDDAPLNPSTKYILTLAAVARKQGLDTGVLWGLPKMLGEATDLAIQEGRFTEEVKIGWDPCHVQVTGITPTEARKGGRPK